MGKNDSIAYVGQAELHDARIVSVCYTGDQLRVTLKPHDGKELQVSFTGVKGLTANQPVGMTIYALNEMRADAPFRRFVFTNWDEQDPACLDLEARDFTISSVLTQPA